MNVRDPFNIHRRNNLNYNNFQNGAFIAINLLRASATQATQAAEVAAHHIREKAAEAVEVGSQATQAAAAHLREVAVEAVEVGSQALEKGRQAFANEAENEELLPRASTAVIEERIKGDEDNTMSFSVPKNVPSFTNPQRALEDRLWPSSGVTKHRSGLGGVQDRVGNFLNPDRGALPMYKDKPCAYPPSGRPRPIFRRKRVLGLLFIVVIILLWFNGSLNDHQEKAKVKLNQWGWLRNDGDKAKSKADWLKRRERVVEAMELSWDAYERYAWGE